MHVPIHEAANRLPDLVSRAEAGEDVVLTRQGLPVARLSPLPRRPTRAEKHALITAIIEEARRTPPAPGPCAARSQDFLYGDDGLPT